MNFKKEKKISVSSQLRASSAAPERSNFISSLSAVSLCIGYVLQSFVLHSFPQQSDSCLAVFPINAIVQKEAKKYEPIAK